MKLKGDENLKKKFFDRIWFNEPSNIMFAFLTKSCDELIPKQLKYYSRDVVFFLR